ncbi:MAG: hypothetical protein AAGF98_18235, partial [Cyanobacteria bacterium P01_H01_bin.153]
MANLTATLPQDCTVPEWLAHCLLSGDPVQSNGSLNSNGSGHPSEVVTATRSDDKALPSLDAGARSL